MATPLQLYFREESKALNEVVSALRDAEADSQRRILSLAGKAGIGAVIRRAQFTIIKRELSVVQRELWSSIGKAIKRNGAGVALAAAEAERQIEAALFRFIGRSVPEELIGAQRAYARRTVVSYFGHRAGRQPLSARVYRSQALSQGWVDRLVNRVILQGGSWQELSRRAGPLIRPETLGGVSYAAKRLARTELNNAFHESSKAVSAANPYMIGMRWNLSNSHPHFPPLEVCELLSRGHSPGKPRGVYAPGSVPEKPHPQCLCYVTSVPMDEDEFLKTILAEPPSAVVTDLAG